MAKLLIVEDNVDLAFGLKVNFEVEGYEVTVVHNGAEGIQQSRLADVDLVLLDLILPDMTGLDVLRTLRAERRAIPVVVLSARGDEIDRVTAFRLGADDYVTKPFSLLELIERVKLRLRIGHEPVTLSSGFWIREARREVTYHGVPIRLKPMEFVLLCYLVRADGAVVARLELLKNVWHARADLTTRTVDNTLVSLNKALVGAGVADAIRTSPRRGVAWTHGRCFA